MKNMPNQYRKLTKTEIAQLITQGCSSMSWELIDVSSQFSAEYICNIKFSGSIKIGVFEKSFLLPGGVSHHTGLYNATLHNCHIGDNVLIDNISEYIANYVIGSECRIHNVERIIVTETTRFGNGVEISVLNEVGGREVPMFNEMSAHFAYIMALYRHNKKLTEKLTTMVTQYASNIESDMGCVGEKTTITGCGSIENVAIGGYATLDGVSRLKNGSINSNKFAPVKVGHNVVAEDFIISSGATVDDGAIIMHSFVGQSCHLSKLFSSHDSLFFSNCQCENGEACAVFAGPYTVSMHKSSLLIAGMFSFLNAGSGSNQSNHLYKLGPIHQGIVERGSKTTSDSYILWPAKIGAFSLIMGRHVLHPDTSELPFSYLIEKNNITHLVPAINLRSVGTIRDAKKWPKRDKRSDKKLMDKINFNLLSPFTIRKMLKGIDILRSLKDICGENTPEYSYNNVSIKNSSLERGVKLYSIAIDKFFGNSLITHLKECNIKTDSELREVLNSTHAEGVGEWIDLSGLIVPKKTISKLVKQIELGEIKTVNEIEACFESLHNDYYRMEWTWSWDNMQRWYNIDGDNVTIEQVIGIVKRWKEAVVTLDKMLYDDAKKEFSLATKVGFGMDGKDNTRRELDFESVRGDFENNPFVKSVVEHIDKKSKLGDEIIAKLSL